MRRLRVAEAEGVAVVAPEVIYEALARFRARRVESFFVLTLNGHRDIVHVYEVTRGLVNRTMAHPREVFWYAIKDMAAAVIVAHNHPSGHCEVSEEDLDITKRLEKAGAILGITVLDHVIFTRDTYVSLNALGIIKGADE